MVKNQAVFTIFVFVAIFVHLANSLYVHNTQNRRVLFLQFQQDSFIRQVGIIFGRIAHGKGQINEYK